MFEWSEEQLAIRDAVRRFVEEEIKPNVDELEHGDTPPYDGDPQALCDLRPRRVGPGVLQAGDSNARRRASRRRRGPEGGGNAALTLIPIIELCHYCPGIVTALGVSIGLAGGTIMKSGTPAQMERWGLDLMTLDKIGAWAITEPDSGSDAFGGMKATAVRDGDEYVLERQQDVHHQRPVRRHHRLLRQARRRERDGAAPAPGADLRPRPGMAGLEQSKPFRKMGLHSSPTGELFLTDVRAGTERLLGENEEAPDGNEGRESAKGNFVIERAGVAAMSLGIIEECLEAVGAVRQGPAALGAADRASSS